jgi:thiaminase
MNVQTIIQETTTSSVAFSAHIWQECIQNNLPQQALKTIFFKGILNGDLSVDTYALYMIQDIAYMQHGSENWQLASEKALLEFDDQELADFCGSRSKSWARYASLLSNKYHVKVSGVITGPAATAYIEYEREVIEKYGAVYQFVACYACVKLWPFIAQELKKLSSVSEINNNESTSNVYQFWIDSNMDEHSAVRIETWLDKLYRSGKLNKELAIQIVSNCIKFEINFFKEACNEPTEPVINLAQNKDRKIKQNYDEEDNKEDTYQEI